MSKHGSPLDPISLDGVRTSRLEKRHSKVSLQAAGRPWTAGGTFREFLARLPHILAAESFRQVVERVVQAKRRGARVLLGMGAHPIKVGLGPVIVDLMERRLLDGVALNGAGIIHDAELALAGHTSEDVAAALVDGSFGMTADTADFLNAAIKGARAVDGLGAAVGRALLASGAPHLAQSIVAAGARLNLPVTVHVALGTDTIHLHPSVDPAATGAASHLDFRIFARAVSGLQGGVYLNVGSAVLLPEVFLKAVTLVRNLGYQLDDLTTVNMDFHRHYRPRVNVLQRPTRVGGRGIELIGHHEIMIPLLAAAIVERMAGENMAGG
ncbi:MAG: hypothetical protein JRJ12_05060 [Deltaproteobacteria bacterium]|nr:hypothetical protein [Deltaproteobacteria bacterium]MBW2069962.1 hypothetical protein [Deltaproteobacteria bacterium]